jgi:sialate O-acetylesterase
VIIDIGNSKDIHPRNKQDVGKRLALLALGKTYKLDIPHESPMFESMTTDRNTVTIRFKNTYGGLTVRNKYGYVNGFEVAGTDQKFHYAQARLQDGQVIVTCDKVTSPVAVRYGWADDPNDLNLYNSASLPAAPFRTDNWDKKTKGVRFGY